MSFSPLFKCISALLHSFHAKAKAFISLNYENKMQGESAETKSGRAAHCPSVCSEIVNITLRKEH